MKTKGIRYAVRDGFGNLRRYPLILLASITTMLLMLLLLSAFVLLAYNVQFLMEQVGEQPPIELRFKVGVAPETVYALDQEMTKNALILEHRILTPEQNFQQFKERIGKEKLFDEFDYKKYIPWTIQIRLADPALGEGFKAEIQKQTDVQEVLMEAAVMDFLELAMRRTALWGGIVFVFLCVIAVFIIANMVRVVALSRSTEISIMKYMGATNKYISIPFLIEGVLVGLVSAFLSNIVCFFAYETILRRYSAAILGAQFRLLPQISVLPQIILLTFAVAVLMGGLTSGVSVRKYIRV